jgi:hypothetical protein
MNDFSIFLLSLLSGGLLPFVTPANHYIESRQPEITKQVKSLQEIPSVDAEITSIFPSPDYACVALVLKKGEPQEETYSLTLFNPDEKRVIAETSVQFGWDHNNIQWASDSRWVAAIAKENKIVLMNKKGETRFLQTSAPASDSIYTMVWRGDKPNRLIYIPPLPSGSKELFLHEMNTETGQERKIAVKHRPETLFLVHGKPWVGYHTKDKSFIHVAQVDPWKNKMDIPLYDTRRWDPGLIIVSPDGQYFTFSAWYSASSRSVIARVKDAKIVFREPLRAVLWHDGIEETYEVDWLQDINGKRKYKTDEIFVSRALGENTVWHYFLDMTTGSLNEIMLFISEEFRQLVRWKSSDSSSHYLVVTHKGLESVLVPSEQPPALWLRHTVLEKDAEEE